MSVVYDIVKKLDSIAPFDTAESYDNVGLLVGDRFDRVSKALVCLDITVDVLDEAKHSDVNLVISHHPVIFDSLKSVTKQNSGIVYDMIRHGISGIAVHTNLDIALGGVNDVLMSKLCLGNRRGLCSVDDMSMGCVGELDRYMSADEFGLYVKEKLGANGIRYTAGERKIKTVAVCCGSGGFAMEMAMQSRADAFVTGDVKHDVFVTAQNQNFTLVDAGHYATEIHIVDELVKMLNAHFDDCVFMTAKSGGEKVKYI